MYVGQVLCQGSETFPWFAGKGKGGLTVAAKKEFFETGNNMARLL